MPRRRRHSAAPAPEAGLPSWGKYCLDCHYPLEGLASWQCPECGRPFNPEKPDTFTREPAPPPRWVQFLAGEGLGRLTRGASGVALVLLVVPVQIVLLFTPLAGCVIVPVFPCYVGAGTWLVMNLVRQEGVGGFVYWTIIGVVAGALLGAPQQIVGMLFGAGIGLIVALVRTYFEL